MSQLFSTCALGSLDLQNRLVMSPMTRNRSTDNIPNELMVEYYRQRASAGLIVTEGTSPSPNGLFTETLIYDPMAEGYAYLARQLHALGLVYVHLVDHSSMSAPVVPADIKTTFRDLFGGTLILSGGYDAATAENDLAQGKADLIGVGRPFLANPDLPVRWQINAPLNESDYDTFYTPGARGYTDYPVLSWPCCRGVGKGDA